MFVQRSIDFNTFMFSRDVAKNMLKFLSCYIWLMLGFMMAFVIFFNTERNLQSFPDPLITLLVWMLGELEYKDGFYPEDEEINLERDENGTLTGKGTVDGVAAHLQFPGFVNNNKDQSHLSLN